MGSEMLKCDFKESEKKWETQFDLNLIQILSEMKELESLWSGNLGMDSSSSSVVSICSREKDLIYVHYHATSEAYSKWIFN